MQEAKGGYYAISSNFKQSIPAKPVKPVLKPGGDRTNYNGRNEQYEIAERYYKGTAYEKKPNGYDIYSYGKIPLTSRNNPYGQIPANPQLSQSFYRQQDSLNQSFCVNPNQSMYSYRKEVNPYELQSKSFYLNSERSIDLNSSINSIDFKFDASPVKKSNPQLATKIKNCATKCKDLQSDLSKLKEYTTTERQYFRQQLKELKRLILEKENSSLMQIEIGTQTNIEDVSMIDEQLLDDNSLDQMSIIDKLGVIRGEGKENLSEPELEFENKENELCTEISKLKNRVELPEVEFRTTRRKTSLSNAMSNEPQELDCEMLCREFPLGQKKNTRSILSTQRNENIKDEAEIKSAWILWLLSIVLFLAALHNFLL